MGQNLITFHAASFESKLLHSWGGSKNIDARIAGFYHSLTDKSKISLQNRPQADLIAMAICRCRSAAVFTQLNTVRMQSRGRPDCLQPLGPQAVEAFRVSGIMRE